MLFSRIDLFYASEVPAKIRKMAHDFVKSEIIEGQNLIICVGTKLRVVQSNKPGVRKTGKKKWPEMIIPGFMQVEIPLKEILLESQKRIPFNKIPLRVNSSKIKDMDRKVLRYRLEKGDVLGKG